MTQVVQDTLNLISINNAALTRCMTEDVLDTKQLMHLLTLCQHQGQLFQHQYCKSVQQAQSLLKLLSSDPVVNEVITRPVNATASAQPTNTQSSTQTAQAEPKAEKKTEAKPVAKQTRAEAKNEVTQTAPVMVDVPVQTQPLMIVDMLFRNMVKKPIQDNNRSYYALIMGSQKTHEEMVDEQYRKRD